MVHFLSLINHHDILISAKIQGIIIKVIVDILLDKIAHAYKLCLL